jgi:hemoglobin
LAFLPALGLAAGLMLAAGSAPVGAQEASLFDRLGGKTAALAVVDEFVNNMAADPQINRRFANTDLARLRRLFFEQVCEATGGPCSYTGRDMPTTHQGMNISREEFDRTGMHLAAALDRFGVPEKEKGEVLAAIGSMQGDVIGK